VNRTAGPLDYGKLPWANGAYVFPAFDAPGIFNGGFTPDSDTDTLAQYLIPFLGYSGSLVYRMLYQQWHTKSFYSFLCTHRWDTSIGSMPAGNVIFHDYQKDPFFTFVLPYDAKMPYTQFEPGYPSDAAPVPYYLGGYSGTAIESVTMLMWKSLGDDFCLYHLDCPPIWNDTSAAAKARRPTKAHKPALDVDSDL